MVADRAKPYIDRGWKVMGGLKIGTTSDPPTLHQHLTTSTWCTHQLQRHPNTRWIGIMVAFLRMCLVQGRQFVGFLILPLHLISKAGDISLSASSSQLESTWPFGNFANFIVCFNMSRLHISFDK